MTAAAIAVGAVGVAAVDPSPSPSPSTTTPSPGTSTQDGDGPHGFLHRGRGGMFGPPIHGQFVVPKSGGGYQTMDQQRGQVTAVSSTSITVESADGFSKTYAVTSSTIVRSTQNRIADVHNGDQVGVAAVEENGGATALRIIDRTQVGEGRHKYLPRPDSSGSTRPSGFRDDSQTD